MTQEELNKILEDHALWLEGKGGKRADLSGASLREADLSGASLRGADLCEADLRGASLCEADLCRANLYGAKLREADLYGAKLREADLYGADLYGAKLREADLCRANLCEANLCRANLRGADLCEANLYGAALSGASLYEANLYRADLRGADLCEANIDYNCWPLWCGSLDAHIDTRIAVQLLYHLMRPCLVSHEVDDAFKRALFTPELIEWANKFHRVGKCGKICPPKEIKHCEPDKRCASCMHYADGVCYRGTAPGYLEMREDDACTRWEGKKDDGES